jgi:hypothetical protein
MTEPVEGTLFVARSQAGQPEGSFREERVPFRSLQELLDVCVAQAQGGAFVRVQVVGRSAGQQHRLVLDFGHFGLFAE